MNSGDFNNFDQNWSQPTYGGYNPPPRYGAAPPPPSNIIRVTSLDEAIMRTTVRGSDMLYVNQDKDEFYRVRVDYDGKKTWGEFQFTVPNKDHLSPATKADIEMIFKRLEALEKLIKPNDSISSANVVTEEGIKDGK